MTVELFMMNPKGQEINEPMWSQIDNYFKMKLVEEQNHDALSKVDRKSKEFSREFTADEKIKGLINSL